jgi:hypothetical protein
MKTLRICIVGIGCILTSLSSAVAAETTQRPAVIIDKAGRNIHIDPATGQRSSPPLPPTMAPGLTNRVSTSTDGLQELPVTAKPGGFKVHLGGRFQSAITVTNDGASKPALHCLSQHEITSTSSNSAPQQSKAAR